MMKKEDNKEDNNEDVLRDLIEEALKINIKNTNEFNNHKELADTLGPVIAEFLDSFIVVGYDFDGEAISFQGSKNSQQKDALDTLFLKYFYKRTGYKVIDGTGSNEFM